MTAQSHNKKALFFDIDGTICDNLTKTIPESTRRAFALLNQIGHLTFLNTGRTYCMSHAMAEDLGTTGLICGCGTHVYAEGKTLSQFHVPYKRCREICAILKEKKIDAVFEGSDGIYFSGHPFEYYLGDRLAAFVALTAGAHYDCLDEDFVFDKFCTCMHEEGEGDNASYYEMLEGMSDFEAIFRGRNFHELVPKGYTQASGIDVVLKHYGLTYEDAYVFGDSANDLAMFKSGVKHRIIMQDHDEVLEPYATYTAGRINEDGLYKALEDLGLLKNEDTI